MEKEKSTMEKVLDYLASDEYADRVKSEFEKYYGHPSVLAQVERPDRIRQAIIDDCKSALGDLRAEAEEKARIFGEYCGYAGAYMWHAGFHKWMNKYSGEYTKEGLMLTTTELFASPEFLAYYEERKSK